MLIRILDPRYEKTVPDPGGRNHADPGSSIILSKLKLDCNKNYYYEKLKVSFLCRCQLSDIASLPLNLLPGNQRCT